LEFVRIKPLSSRAPLPEAAPAPVSSHFSFIAIAAMTTPKLLPSDARKLLAEASARISIRDIKRLHSLRDDMSSQWWEWVAGIAVFPAALGFFLTLARLVEANDLFAENQRFILRFLWIWAGLFVFALLACYEILARKHRAMRRYLRELEREIEEGRRDRDAMRQALLAISAPPQAPRGGTPTRVSGAIATMAGDRKRRPAER
jgi:hypothetical protein